MPNGKQKRLVRMGAQSLEFRVRTLARDRCARGFTFVEILIVLVIVSIVALLAIPVVSSEGGMQVRSAANLIAADLEFAKNKAIGTGERFSVVFDVANESYAIKDRAGNTMTHPVKKGFDYVVNLRDEGLDRVDIVAVYFDGTSEIGFDYLGTPYNGAGNPLNTGGIGLKAGDATMTITVDPATGFISIAN